MMEIFDHKLVILSMRFCKVTGVLTEPSDFVISGKLYQNYLHIYMWLYYKPTEVTISFLAPHTVFQFILYILLI